MTGDLWQALILLGLVGFLAMTYLVRVAVRGRAKFDRVEKQGGSKLLSKEVMEMAYWGVQPLGKLLVFLRITPNQVSWSSLVFAILAGACLSVGHFGFGAVFATISAFLDSLDGIVARLTGKASDAGEVLDAAVDRYSEFLFLGGLAIYYREIPVLLGLSLLALMGSFMVSYSSAKAEALQVSAPSGSMRRPERAVYLILGALLSPLTIPIFETDRPYSIAMGHPMVIALCLVAVLANVSAVERLWAIAKAIRVREAEERRLAMAQAEESAELEADTVSSQRGRELT